MNQRQQAILNLFQIRQGQNLPPPTMREIVEATDITSTSVARYNLDRLVEDGALVHLVGKARGYRLPFNGRVTDRELVAGLEARIAELEGLLADFEAEWQATLADLETSKKTIARMIAGSVTQQRRINELERLVG